MDPQIVTGIVSAMIGMITGLSVALLTHWQQSRLEYRKWLRTQEEEHQRWLQAKEDEVNRELRLAVAELTKAIAAATHVMSWLTWKAKHEPDGLTGHDLSNYDKEIHNLFVSIVGGRILVAALDNEMHSQMTSIVENVYAIDEQIAQAAIVFRKSPQEGTRILAELSEKVALIDSGILGKVTELIGAKQVKRQFEYKGT